MRLATGTLAVVRGVMGRSYDGREIV
jgi:hypothetical protein